MAENKTKPTEVGVDRFLDGVSEETKREDSKTLIQMMTSITGEPPKMWGPTMIGFGTFHYVYAGGHEGDIFLTGFSPRKNALTIYLSCGCTERFADLIVGLGKAKASKGCLYVRKLADIDLSVLRELIETSIAVAKDMSKPKLQSTAEPKPKTASSPKRKVASQTKRNQAGE